jgi:Nod factor-specific ABC transporter NodJ protein
MSVLGDKLRLGHVGAVAERDWTLLRAGGTYFWLVLSSFVEPVLYLLAIGWGVGVLVGDIRLDDGTSVPYLTFLAPGMLAVSAMNGSLAESTINFFAKLRYFKHYGSVLNTPVTPAEIAFGELGWATIRGGLYSGSFLVVMALMGLISPLAACAAFPATLLVGLAFGALGLALSSFMRDWEDFEYSGVVQFALFLFSGTVVPLASYPGPLRFVVELTPLYHGVELLRAVALGTVGWGCLAHVSYLVVLTTAGIVVAARRIRHRLQP